MNKDIIEGQWAQIKGKVKEKFAKLTDDDLGEMAGHRDYLIGKVQERYGIAKEKAEEQVDAFAKSLH